MKLKHLIEDLDIKEEIKPKTINLSIKGIAENSDEVSKDYIFVAVNGYNSNGHDYIGDAIEKGACVIIGETDIPSLPVPYIRVDNSRKALGVVAKNFYGNPSKSKLMIGITGTNGKTTTSYLLKHILEESGKTCSLIGTIQYVINGNAKESSNTTPSALDLQKLLYESKDEVIIVEVSSHGLSQQRIEGAMFDFCLFTNLEHEHLDYHDTIEEYFQTKMLLFNYLKDSGQAIVNTDNYWGEKLVKTLEVRGITVYGVGQYAEDELRILRFNNEKSTIAVKENDEINHIFSPMNGIHNMYNTAMAYKTSRLLGIPKEGIIESLSYFEGVKGRFETIKLFNGATVVIDYAHTEDAVFHCLTTAKKYGAKKVIHVFGFRGDRDQFKRQGMLAITSELSDRFVLTMDDLNTISYSEMIETLNYLNINYGNEKGVIIPDRTLAIKWAIEYTNQDDWIIITGKGHETYQQNYHSPTNSDQETVRYIANQQDKNRFGAL
ncbi:UDP-N-acetylmuramoyl-L-alanyl-D-glutamate--2,6-diaminopimelate ligase [Virgibacillus kimchii]